MGRLIILCVLLCVSIAINPKFPEKRHVSSLSNDLPTLYQIKNHSFAGPYGCVSGYAGSALFLTGLSNAPELLFYGNCPPSSSEFWCATSGNDLAQIVDLGKLPLTNFSANDVIYDRGFQEQIPAIEGHTYFAIITRDDLRALLAWSVVSLKQSGAMDIQYAVMLYERHQIVSQAPGWSWGARNKN